MSRHSARLSRCNESSARARLFLLGLNCSLECSLVGLGSFLRRLHQHPWLREGERQGESIISAVHRRRRCSLRLQPNTRAQGERRRIRIRSARMVASQSVIVRDDCSSEKSSAELSSKGIRSTRGMFCSPEVTTNGSGNISAGFGFSRR